MSHILQHIDSVFLVVKEFEKSIEWYRTKLQVPLSFQTESIAAFEIGNHSLLTLVNDKYMKENESHPLFNFYTEDIEGAHNFLIEKGIFPGPIRNYGNLYTFDFTDLDGHLLNVVAF